jgi:hypothetical protein
MSPRADHSPHQPRPNRRYRRLLPTALAVTAFAAMGSTLGAPPAPAAGGASPPRRAQVHGGPSRAALAQRGSARGTTETQDVTAT